jgi:hypothetical protein
MRNNFGMQAFISCGREGSGDACRKPSPGMWHLLERHLNCGVKIDKERLFCTQHYIIESICPLVFISLLSQSSPL